MLIAFGFSWPFAILRTYRAKRVDGKSPQFMFIVIFGYWLCIVYLIDIALVSTDLALYFHYARKNREHKNDGR